jgi:hypothetical protein
LTNFGGDVVVPDRFANQRRAPSCAAGMYLGKLPR